MGGDRLDGVTLSDRVDAVVLHPVLGPLILAVILFLVFQAVFAWAQVPMDEIKLGVAAFGDWLGAALPASLLKDLLINGVLAGVGSVLVFLPQIIILFFFILVLEDSGYLPRAAFLARPGDGQRRAVGPRLHSAAVELRLRHSRDHGDAHHPKSARSTGDHHDRAADDLFGAPAGVRADHRRLHPAAHGVGRPGIAGRGVVRAVHRRASSSAMAVAFVLKRSGTGARFQALMLELPAYHWPNLRNLGIGLWQRVEIFMSRVGTIILALMVILWALSSFPAPPPGATGPAIQYSIAGHLGAWLAVLFAPIGFNWQISIALVPGLAAREVAVGALGTVYALSATGNDVSGALTPLIAQSWSLPTALSLLAWYVFAPQCLSTLATVKRETNSWRYPIIMAAYMFALAYVGSWITYRIAMALTS